MQFKMPGAAPADAKGKGVVITGAAGGVGYAYADEFLANGLKVLMFYMFPFLPWWNVRKVGVYGPFVAL